MAGEELKYLDEILAAHPDNTQGLINPLDNRDGWIAGFPTVGVIADNTGGIIAAGVDVSVNLELSPVYLGGQAVDMDGNGALFHDYGALTVPAGYTKIVQAQAQFTFESSTNEATILGFALNGVTDTDTTVEMEWNNNSVPQALQVIGWMGVDVSVANAVTLIFTKLTGTATITNFQMALIGYSAGAEDVSGGSFLNGVNHGIGT